MKGVQHSNRQQLAQVNGNGALKKPIDSLKADL